MWTDPTALEVDCTALEVSSTSFECSGAWGKSAALQRITGSTGGFPSSESAFVIFRFNSGKIPLMTPSTNPKLGSSVIELSSAVANPEVIFSSEFELTFLRLLEIPRICNFPKTFIVDKPH
eukprot:747977_1